ncbi:hypothetical protein ACWEV3_38915 [Saccharopolyspora sp. NPDC003752]
MPREWAKQSADSTWDPATLGAAGPPQPAVLVAKSATGFPNPDDTGQGVFAGVLPPGTALSTTDFDDRVTRDHCAPTTGAAGRGRGLADAADAALRRGRGAGRADVRGGPPGVGAGKQPSTEVTQTDEVLASLTITP